MHLSLSTIRISHATQTYACKNFLTYAWARKPTRHAFVMLHYKRVKRTLSDIIKRVIISILCEIISCRYRRSLKLEWLNKFTRGLRFNYQVRSSHCICSWLWHVTLKHFVTLNESYKMFSIFWDFFRYIFLKIYMSQ